MLQPRDPISDASASNASSAAMWQFDASKEPNEDCRSNSGYDGEYDQLQNPFKHIIRRPPLDYRQFL